MLLLVGYALVMQHRFVGSIGDDGFLQIRKETFDEAGNQIWIFDVFQILVVSAAELLQSLVFLIDGDALPEDALFLESFGFGSEVVDQKLDNDRNAELSQFIILQLVDFLLN